MFSECGNKQSIIDSDLIALLEKYIFQIILFALDYDRIKFSNCSVSSSGNPLKYFPNTF
jgi:hypothetical protein